MKPYEEMIARAINKEKFFLEIYNFFHDFPKLKAANTNDLVHNWLTKIVEEDAPSSFFDSLRDEVWGLIDELKKDGLINSSGQIISLSLRGFMVGQSSTAAEATRAETSDFIPASDRIVKLDDNAPEVGEAIKRLQELEETLTSGSNELPLTSDERQVIASETRSLLDRLRSGWVRIGEIQRAVTKGSPLVWLLDKAGGTAIGLTVGGAITALGLLAKALLG